MTGNLASLFKQALDLHGAGRLQDAKALYLDVIKIAECPASDGERDILANVQHNLAHILILSGNHVAAIPHLEASVKGSPTISQYWITYVGALLATEDLLKAYQAVLDAIQIGHSGPAIRELLALTVSKLKNKSTMEFAKPTDFFFPSTVEPHTWFTVRKVAMDWTVEMISQERREGVRILEVGSWCGASVVTWADALSRHLGSKTADSVGEILCVDRWESYFAEDDLNPEAAKVMMNEAARTGAAYEIFRHNCNIANLRWGVSIHHARGRSKDILPLLRDKSFDIVYIDGSHAYSDVVADISQAKRLVADGGVICGDDLELMLHQVSREYSWVNREGDYVPDPSSKVPYHPGVTLAVGESFPAVSNYFGYWIVKSTNGRFEPIRLPVGEIHPPAYLDESGRAEFIMKARNLLNTAGAI